MPYARYYGGTQFIDLAEELAQKRALELFKLDPLVWGVSVQALSGSTANFHSFNAVLKLGDKVMGLKREFGGVNSIASFVRTPFGCIWIPHVV